MNSEPMIFVLVMVILVLGVFSRLIELFIVNPIICKIKGHKYKEFFKMDNEVSLQQCERCFKCSEK